MPTIFKRIFLGYVDLAEILVEYVKQLSSTQTIKFVAMENIAQHLGASYLLKNFEDLQDTLLNGISEPTISDQVSIFIIINYTQPFYH